MVLLKFITIYALLGVASHYFLFQYCPAFVKKNPDKVPVLDYMLDVLINTIWWQRIIVIAVGNPFFIIMQIGFLAIEISYGVKMLRIRVNLFRTRALINLIEYNSWYKKRIFKKRFVYWGSCMLFGRINTKLILSATAGSIVIEALLSALTKLPDESKNTDTVSHPGAPEEIS